MPNLCSNFLEVSLNEGDENLDGGDILRRDAFRQFFQENKGDEGSLLSFQNAVPISNEITYHQYYLRKWGTSEDAFEVTLCGESSYNIENIDENTHFLKYEFTTNWRPPISWATAISSKYPKLNFNLGYIEEGQDFWGYINFEGGTEVNCRNGRANELAYDILSNWYKIHGYENFTELHALTDKFVESIGTSIPLNMGMVRDYLESEIYENYENYFENSEVVRVYSMELDDLMGVRILCLLDQNLPGWFLQFITRIIKVQRFVRDRKLKKKLQHLQHIYKFQNTLSEIIEVGYLPPNVSTISVLKKGGTLYLESKCNFEMNMKE